MSNWPIRGRPDQEPSRFQIKTVNQIVLQTKEQRTKSQQHITQLMTYDQFNALEKEVIGPKKIDENFNVNTWNVQFLYQTVNFDDMKSAFLDNNNKFQELKNMLQEYNSEVKDAEVLQKNIRNGAWRSVFYTQMLKLMREIMFTTNREIQTKFVDQVYSWAQGQVTQMDYQGKNPDKPMKVRPETGKSRPFSSDRRPFSGATSKQLRPTSGYPYTSAGETMAESTLNMSFDTRPESAKLQTIGEDGTVIVGKLSSIYTSLSQGKELSRMQPSDIIHDTMRDYNSQSRTQHPNYDPPKSRLQNYKRRIISAIDTSKQINNNNKPPVAQQKRTFPKPQSAKTQSVPFYEQTIIGLPSFTIPGMTKTIEVTEQVELVVVVEGEQVQQKIEEVKKQEFVLQFYLFCKEEPPRFVIEEEKQNRISLEPRIQTFKIDEQGEDTFKNDLNKKFETRSIYTNYEPTEDKREMRLEQIYIKGRNKEAFEKREAEEMIGFMTEWSHAKGRVEKELVRRIESATVGNHYKQVRMLDRDGKDIERIELDKIQVKHQKALNGEYVPTQVDLHLSDMSEEQNDLEDDDDEIANLQDESNYMEGDSAIIEEDKQQKKRTRLQSKLQVHNQLIDLKTQLPQVVQRNYYKNDTDIHDLELKMAQQKVNQVKKLHGALIGLAPSANVSPEKIQDTGSLSIFTQNHQKLFRPFSAAIEMCPPDQMRLEQLKEIAEIKSRLAKHKINIPIQTLMTAMMIPNQLSDPQGVQIPDVGYGIMDRGEKKKKKKSKKKKRK